jgi:uncharacterized delta-60 repeat protein
LHSRKNYEDYICKTNLNFIMKKFILPLVAFFFFGVNAFAQPGTLDLTFDTDGIVLVNPTNVFDNAQDVIVLGDNKIFICGTTGMFTDFDMMVAKLNEDGSFDTSFANNGIFTLANTAGSDFAYDMDLLPNGNLIVVGAKSLSAADTQFAAWVIKPDGTLDPSFAVNGVYEDNLDTGEEYINQVLINNNLIYLVGRKFTPGFSSNSIAVQCLDLQGNLVTAFGTNGTATYQTASTDEFSVNGAAMVTEGAIAICGDKYNPNTFTSVPMIMLMTLTGGPVGAFGTNGLWLDATGGTYYDIEYANSKLIAVGTNGSSSMARRHNIDGSYDTSFGTSGTFANAVGGYSAFYDCTLGADNKWYACGTTSSGFMVRDFVATRFSNDGVLDATWGGTGNVVTSLGDSFDDSYGIGLQLDGKVVCAGLTSQPGGNDMGVVRYQGDNGIIYVSGCTSTDACNFDPAANVENGTCYFIGDPCDDGLATTDNDAYNFICICEGVSSVEESNAFGLTIFPNPSLNEITLTSDVVGKGTVSIVDMTGRVVLQNKMVIAASQRITIQDLTNGIYSLVVTVDQKQSVVSFVKI